ncbi:MAG: penicillin-binding protein 1A [Gammaproteobacteria bacterium]
MTRGRRLLRYSLIGLAGLGLLGVVLVGGTYLYVAPSLPSVAVLKDIHLQVPLRVYTRDGKLVATFGTRQRVPLNYDQIPPLLTEAFISAEDERFFEHSGVDFRGMTRAALNLIETGHKSQGGSTITMQVARNFFLTRKKRYIRKIREMFLAMRMSKELSKEDVMRLYLNKIYLGEHAYGVGAAARIYYGKDVWQLTLAQMAMLAGLPQAPSSANPLVAPKRALARRAYVLGRMRFHGYIGEGAYKRAMRAPVTAQQYTQRPSVEAPYLAEMVRDYMIGKYGKAAYSGGYRVTTTLDSRLQRMAVASLRDDLEQLDRQKGWRGPIAQGALAANAGTSALSQSLAPYPPVANLMPGVVTSVGEKNAQVYLRRKGSIVLGWKGLAWAAGKHKRADGFLKRGDIVYVRYGKLRINGRVQGPKKAWRLAQIPKLQGAVVALDPYDGAIVALDGGFSFALSKYNRAIQAHRQLGSSFKPFVYSAALAKGMTPATMISNAPFISVANKALNKYWRPRNAERETSGMMRLRAGLVHSVNLVAIRILQQIGIPYALDWARRFGFSPANLPHNLTLALGSASLTPLAMARGYAVFANGGFLVRPYFIQRIVGPSGKTIASAHPWVACTDCAPATETQANPLALPVAATAPSAPESAAAAASATPAASARSATQAFTLGGHAPPVPRLAPRTISAQNAWLMTSILQSVIQRGTGVRARALGRNDLSGKTGTTNKNTDAWFDGFGPRLVAVTWVGYDQPSAMGHGWTGAHTALPMWIDFMGASLQHVPEFTPPMPTGLVTVRIDKQSGLRCEASDPNAMWETFRAGTLPPEQKKKQAPSLYGGGTGP